MKLVKLTGLGQTRILKARMGGRGLGWGRFEAPRLRGREAERVEVRDATPKASTGVGNGVPFSNRYNSTTANCLIVPKFSTMSYYESSKSAS